MKKRIWGLSNILLAIVLLVYCCIPVACASSYSDVSGSDWHAEAIEYVKDAGLMAGTGAGTFRPNQLLTRSQIVAIFYRLAGNPEVEYMGRFQDVPIDAWYAPAVAWAYQMDITHGTTENTFSPSSNITREQLAVMLYNYLKAETIELPEAENPFWQMKDCWSVSPYAEKGVQTACDVGLMNPDQQYNFNPRKGVTRADAAVVFMRLSKALAGEKLTGSLIPNTAIDFTKYSQKQKDASALAVAQQIASVIPTDRSDAERIAMAAHIVSNYCKYGTYSHYMSGKDYRTAYGLFVKGDYTCAGTTRALGLVLTCMGYPWKHVNENQYEHQWCQLTIDGRTLMADGQTGEVWYENGDEDEYVSHLFAFMVDPWPYTRQ